MTSNVAATSKGDALGPPPITRRRIYLQRLIGDAVFGDAKQATARREPVQVVLRFLVYLILATIVITTRSMVGQIHQINYGIETALQNISFDAGAGHMYFSDITTTAEMQAWTRQVLLLNIRGTAEDQQFRRNLTLLSYNRVVPAKGICTDFASVTMTMRRVRTTWDYKDSTTSRFRQFYPTTWVAAAVPAGLSPDPAAEAATPIRGATPDAAGERRFWMHTDSAEGYLGNGGYIAVVSLNADGETYFHLMDYDGAAPKVDPSASICSPLPVGATLVGDEFWEQAFFDASFSSLALEFTAYNANLQTLSQVSLVFNANYAGRVLRPTLTSQTIVLDVFSPSMRYFEIAYGAFTGAYFLEFSYSAWKRFPAFFFDLWTWINFVSIVMSFISLALWYSYVPFLGAILQGKDFLEPIEVKSRFVQLQFYKQASALATLSIYLRLLQFLANTKPRVMLLARTLKMGAGNMFIYMSYIAIIFYGFAAFAQTYFSSFSDSFGSPGSSFLSCFELFFGQVSVIDTIEGSSTMLKYGFYICYMVFFYFVSVQMFNAIINYAYNRVSEEMEPQFEHEKNEQKRKAMQAKLEGNTGGMLQSLKNRVKGLLRSGTAAPPNGGGEEESQDAHRSKESGSASMENMDDDVKLKVETYLEKDKDLKAPDGMFNKLMFLVFAVAYLWFLFANLSIQDNFQINQVVQGSIASAAVQAPGGRTLRWDDIVTLPQAALWVREALPLVIFNTTHPATRASAVAAGIYDASAVCMKSWNCLVQMAEGTSSKKILRLSQRRARVQTNDGRLNADTPDLSRFIGGKDEATGLDMSRALVAERSASSIDPRAPPDPALEQSADLGLDPALLEFCVVAAENAETSYGEYGGLVCTLDADYNTFLAQMDLMMQSSFFTPDSSTWIIDFAMQNSNKQILSYAVISFMVLSSGVVEKECDVETITLFNLENWYSNFWEIFLRLLPGIVYMCLTLRFIRGLYEDLRKEQFKRRLRDGQNALTATLDFFRFDIFNTLEAASISVSLFSAGLFIGWLWEDGRLAMKKTESFSAFLSYCGTLAFQAQLYNQLSAFNVLMIGVRPLKFVRENPRIAKLNQTLWDAAPDIAWFVVMIFVTMSGFVMLTYISFGPYVKACSTLLSTLVYCFRYLLGDFDYSELLKADPVMTSFMVPYLIIMYCVFCNIFFAIIDRHYVAVDAMPFQWKQKLKPLLQRCCRCIEWDEDLVMEEDPNAEKKAGPPSRRNRVKVTQRKIQDIYRAAGETQMMESTQRSQDLSEVCDIDDRMDDVLMWSRNEGRRFVLQFSRLLARKRNATNDDHFVKNDVIGTFVHRELAEAKAEMNEAARQMRYATRVHERNAFSDQETLARYVCILERKVQRQLASRSTLRRDVDHLKAEAQHICYGPPDFSQSSELQVLGGADEADDVGSECPSQHGESEDRMTAVATSATMAPKDSVGTLGAQASAVQRDPMADTADDVPADENFAFAEKRRNATDFLVASLGMHRGHASRSSS